MKNVQHLFNTPKTNIISMWVPIIKNISRYSFLINRLVRINILREFKRSFIGLTWLFILPLIAVLTWVLLQGAGIVQPGNTGIPYPAYVLLSTSIWGFFADMYKKSSLAIVSSGKMLIMSKFPHEVLIAEQVLVHIMRFIIPFSLNIVVLLLFGVRFTWMSLLFPFTLIPLLLLGLSIGMIVSLFRVVAVDFGNVADEGIKLLMFVTPVIYAPTVSIKWLATIITYNPLTYLIGFSRDVLTKGSFYEPQAYFLCIIATIVIFALSARAYVKAEPKILERLIDI